MILGMPASTYTFLHVLISLIAIGSGFVVMYAMLTGKGLGVLQAFLKLPALKALAPTQTEPPFLVVQLAVLMLFIGLAIVAVRRFHTGPALRA